MEARRETEAWLLRKPRVKEATAGQQLPWRLQIRPCLSLWTSLRAWSAAPWQSVLDHHGCTSGNQCHHPALSAGLTSGIWSSLQLVFMNPGFFYVRICVVSYACFLVVVFELFPGSPRSRVDLPSSREALIWLLGGPIFIGIRDVSGIKVFV